MDGPFSIQYCPILCDRLIFCLVKKLYCFKSGIVLAIDDMQALQPHTWCRPVPWSLHRTEWIWTVCFKCYFTHFEFNVSSAASVKIVPEALLIYSTWLASIRVFGIVWSFEHLNRRIVESHSTWSIIMLILVITNLYELTLLVLFFSVNILYWTIFFVLIPNNWFESISVGHWIAPAHTSDKIWPYLPSTRAIKITTAWKIKLFVQTSLFTRPVCICFSGVWSCIQCKTEYDLDEIEQCLIDAVQRKSMAYLLQDVKCTKCKGVRFQHSQKTHNKNITACQKWLVCACQIPF